MKKILFILLCLGCLLTVKTVKATEFSLEDAKSAILIDADTNTILYEKNSHERLVPASMTKVMSLILICEAINLKKITFDTVITTSEYAASMGGSQIYLKVGEKFTLDDLLKAICIASANDAVVAVSEHLYGSEKLFVDKMNAKASELDLKNTHFSDATGLEKQNHYTSAYDMSLMASYLIKHYGDLILPYTSLKEAYLRQDTDSPFWLVNTNKLIGKVDGVDGLKTGWNDASKYCLTATAKRNNMRLITVLMGYEKPLKRNTDTVSLLNYGFANYESKVLLEKGKVIYEVNDLRFKPSKFNVIIANDVKKVIPKAENDADISWEITKYPDYLTGEAGLIDLYYDDEFVASIPFNSEEKIEKSPFYYLWGKILKYLV